MEALLLAVLLVESLTLIVFLAFLAPALRMSSYLSQALHDTMQRLDATQKAAKELEDKVERYVDAFGELPKW